MLSLPISSVLFVQRNESLMVACIANAKDVLTPLRVSDQLTSIPEHP